MAKIFRFYLPDITCQNCVVAMEKELKTSPLVACYDTNILTKVVSIIVNEPEVDKTETTDLGIVNKNTDAATKNEANRANKNLIDQLQDIIEGVGRTCEFMGLEDDNETSILETETLPYPSSTEDQASTTLSKKKPKPPLKKQNIVPSLIKGIIGTAFSVVMMGLMMSGIGIPFAVMAGLVAINSALTFYLGYHSYKETINSIKTKNLTMDTLFTISSLTMVGVSIASLFYPFPMMMDSTLIFGFWHLGKALEHSLQSKLATPTTFKKRAPKQVEKEEVDAQGIKHYKKMLVSAIKPNDVVRVPSNTVIPLDGTLETDEALIEDNIITGAILPNRYVKGKKMLAGMRVPANVPFILIKVEEKLTGYDLRLMSNDIVLEKKKIYLRESNGYVAYTIITPQGVLIRDSVTDVLAPQPFTLEKLKALESQLLKNIFKAGHIQAEHPAKTSYLAKLDKQIELAEFEKAEIENKTKKTLHYFVPSVLALSLLCGIGVGIFNPILGIQFATTLLVSFCPCVLGLITPLAIAIGMHKASQQGVVFKSSKSLENAASVNTIVFDVNGTLTKGIPEVNCCFTDGNDLETFSLYLSALEEEADNAIGKSIAAYAKQQCRKTSNRVTVSALDKRDSRGIKGIIDKRPCFVGNREFMLSNGIDVSIYDKEVQKRKDALQVIYLAKGNKLLGFVTLKDPLKEDAAFVINQLQKPQKKADIKEVFLCSGASLETIKPYAKRLGVPEDHIFANCVSATIKPDDRTKNDCLEQLKQAGKKVAMVGDAGNDGVSMAACHFGIAVKSNASDVMTQDKAGALVGRSSLLPILATFEVATETMRSVKQNLILSLSYNVSVMLISTALVAVGFALNPGVGVALMILQSSLILLNQYRIKRRQLGYLQAVNEIKSNHDHQAEIALGSSYTYLDRAGLTTNPEKRTQSCNNYLTSSTEPIIATPPSSEETRPRLRPKMLG